MAVSYQNIHFPILQRPYVLPSKLVVIQNKMKECNPESLILIVKQKEECPIRYQSIRNITIETEMELGTLQQPLEVTVSDDEKQIFFPTTNYVRKHYNKAWVLLKGRLPFEAYNVKYIDHEIRGDHISVHNLQATLETSVHVLFGNDVLDYFQKLGISSEYSYALALLRPKT